MSANATFKDQVAIVTGAGQGIGYEMCRQLAEQGAVVILNDLDPVLAQQAAANIDPSGAVCIPMAGNAADLSFIQQMVKTAVDRFGRLDVVIGNAGITLFGNFFSYPEADFYKVLEVNLGSVFRLCRAGGRHFLAQRRGKIINVASLLSFQGGLRVPAYTAAKSAVAGLTRALANEWAPSGINVNAIAPGYMRTDNTEALRADPERNRQILERIPAGRWGEPEDIAGAAVFLASPASDYVTGHVLVVDGGWTSVSPSPF